MCTPQSEREWGGVDCIKNKAAENEREKRRARRDERSEHTVVVVVPQKSSLKYFSFLLGEGERPA